MAMFKIAENSFSKLAYMLFVKEAARRRRAPMAYYDDALARLEAKLDDSTKLPDPARNAMRWGAIGASVAPLSAGIARSARGFAETPGDLKHRLAGAGERLVAISGPELVEQAVRGGATSGGLRYAASLVSRRDREKHDEEEKVADMLMGAGNQGMSQFGSSSMSDPSNFHAPASSSIRPPQTSKLPGTSIKARSVNPRLSITNAISKGLK